MSAPFMGDPERRRWSTSFSVLEFRLGACLSHFARNGNGRLPQHMLDLRFAKTRSVVLKRQMLLGLIEVKAPQAIRVGKLAEAPKLILRERGLQFVSDFHECHARIIPVLQGFRSCGRPPI
jgi:hypothetical protein